MAITELYSGTASVSSTEYSLPNSSTTLTPKTDDGVFQLFLDVSGMAAGDQYEVKIYEKARSGDTQRLLGVSTLTGAQSAPMFVSESFIFMHGWDFTLKKISGTDRTFYWSVRQIA